MGKGLLTVQISFFDEKTSEERVLFRFHSQIKEYNTQTASDVLEKARNEFENKI